MSNLDDKSDSLSITNDSLSRNVNLNPKLWIPSCQKCWKPLNISDFEVGIQQVLNHVKVADTIPIEEELIRIKGKYNYQN